MSHQCIAANVAKPPELPRGGKVEVRASRRLEIRPKQMREANRLRRRSRNGHQPSLRVVSELAKLGFVNERGAAFSASSVQSMIAA